MIVMFGRTTFVWIERSERIIPAERELAGLKTFVKYNASVTSAW